MATMEDLVRVVSRVLLDLKPADSEAAVMSKVLYPILTDGLGISPDDTDLEAPLHGTSEPGGTGRADLVVSMGGAPVLVLEAKAPSRNVLYEDTLAEALTQAERYATRLPVDFVLVSNGYQWLLTKGRRREFEAVDPEDFLKKLPLFYAWLSAENLWYSATGLVVPTTFDERSVLQRCWDLTVDRSDLVWLDELADRYPTFVPRIQEEVRKALAGKEVKRSAHAVPGEVAIAHVDTSFTSYRPGAWRYDRLYERHVSREAEFLQSWIQSGSLRLAIRLFVVDDEAIHARPSDVYRTLRRMLADGWTVALITPTDMERLDLTGGDVVGDHLTTMYPPGEPFDYHFRRDPAAGRAVTEKLMDYVSSNPELTFTASDEDIERLDALALTWWRDRSRHTGPGA